MDVSVDQLQRAVEGQHGGKAVFVEAVPVREMFGREMVWQAPSMSSTWRGILRPLEPMRGLVLSRGATSDGSMPCFT